MQSLTSGVWEGEERVCDNCRVKKTKCNRQKPTCSRCAENRWDCTYRTVKRKPGPPKGSSGKLRNTQSFELGSQSSPVGPFTDGTNNNMRSNSSDQPSGTPGLPVLCHDVASRSSGYRSDITSRFSQPSTALSSPESQWKGYRLIEAESLSSPTDGINPRPQLSAEAELELVEVFFQSIQPHYPLFQKPNFLNHLNSGQIPDRLLSAIFAVSIANSANIEVASLGSSNVSETYALHAWQHCSNIVLYGSSANLDDLNTLFLLGLYEFRNAPNRKAWNVAGHLVRQAYHYGLHQVDTPGGCSYIDAESVDPAEQERLRYLWWSIYTLDTCCNLTIATPSTIDLDMVNTSLPYSTVKQWTDGQISVMARDPLTLHGDMQGISELVMRVFQSRRRTGSEFGTDINFIIRSIDTAILRGVSNVRQMASHNDTSRVQQRWQTQSDLVAALRLALPVDYLDPRRDLPSGESGQSHTLRLVNLMEINLSTLWLNLPKPQDEVSSRPWLMDWYAALDVTDKIVQVIRQWDPALVYLADPAIGYIVFVTMVVIHTHSRLDREETGLAVTKRDQSEDGWQLLKLFLRRLSDHWLLSKALLGTILAPPSPFPFHISRHLPST